MKAVATPTNCPVFRSLACALLAMAAAFPTYAGDGLGPGGDALTLNADASSTVAALARVPDQILIPGSTIAHGKTLFEQDWLIPAEGKSAALAGPHYDRSTCTACHVEALVDAQQAEATPYLVARPLPGESSRRLGAQANTRHALALAPEAEVSIHYDYHTYTYPDGHQRELRKPRAVAVTEDGARLPVALRLAPALFGWGLLEHVDQGMLPPFVDPEDRNGDGISGKAAWVRDACSGRTSLGMFGWKGAHSTLQGQIAAALYHDMGISSRNANGHRSCHPSLVPTELNDVELAAITDFVRYLGVPNHRRDAEDRQRSDQGERLFGVVGCVDCHVPALLTRQDGPIALADQRAWAYTDLMLHDMGPDLADPGEGPSAAEWRTAPLWGVGLIESRYPQRGFLHDGRASNLEDAILWHAGEADRAKRRFVELSVQERQALLAFVRDL